jgi:tetratricopeptide (TPR) repeat protein
VGAGSVRGVEGGPRGARSRGGFAQAGRAAAIPTGVARATPFLVLAVVAAGYLHALGYPFHFDDLSNIRDNAALGPPPDVAGLWHFRPARIALYLSLALNALVTGRTAPGIRAGNLLIHAVAACLVGGIATRLAAAFDARRAEAGRPVPTGRAARVGLWAALLFAAHPLATQAVTYDIQRTASLAALLELGAVACWLEARERGAWPAGAGLLVCAALAALTKEMAVALPLLLVMLAMRLGSPRAWRWVAASFVAWPILLLTMRLPSATLPAGTIGFRETSGIGRLAYLLTQLTVVPRYLRLFLWPRGQSLDPAAAVHPHLDAAVLTGALALASLTLLFVLQRRSRPLALVGWLGCLIALLPESSVFPIRDVMVEHRMYLPLAGLAMIVADQLADLRGASRWAVPAALVVVLTGVTVARNRVWRDEVALWSDVLAKAPASVRGYDNRGLAFEAAGRTVEAEADYRHAIALDSTDVYSLVNLGRLAGQQGRPREGLPLLERARRLAPDAEPALNDLGLTWMALGDTTRAVEAWRTALRAHPEARGPAENLARLHR